MKKLLFALLLTAVASSGIFAQEGDKGMKDANRAFNTYKLDPNNNRAKLGEAVAAIELAAADPITAAQGKTWQLRGDIFNEIATQQINARQFASQGLNIGTDPSTLPKVDHPGLEAAKSYTKALEMAVKKFESKDALKGMQTLQNNLQNLGIYQYEDQDFKSAFRSFAACLEMHDRLVANSEKSMFDEGEKYEDQLYYVGLAGVAAGLNAEAKPYFLKLYDMKADKAAIYEALYTIEAAATSPEAAYKYIEEGRKRYPNEVSLLFAEINHYLRIGKLDALLDQLEKAIELEPNNVSLYTTTGSVYDNLYQQESQKPSSTPSPSGRNYQTGPKGGCYYVTEKGRKVYVDKSCCNGGCSDENSYFNMALYYFDLALEKDPNNVDALYSKGALYYNKAAAMTQELAKLADDYSKAGTEKYNAKQAEMITQFDLALPYFQKSEMINPNDRNTLIALKEIFAKKNDLETSNEFKARLEKLDAGEKNETSYFKK